MRRHIIIPVELERFHSRYIPEPNTGCWLWEGAIDTKGYGQIRTKERLWQAHRFSLFIEMGDKFKHNLCVLHICDNSYCVNPKHLRQGTHQDNMRDCQQKGRNRVPRINNRGEKHFNHILTQNQVIQIRERYSPRIYTIAMLAEEFKVSYSTISKIVQRKQWVYI